MKKTSKMNLKTKSFLKAGALQAARKERRHARGGRGERVPNEVCGEGGLTGDTEGSATNGSPEAPPAPKWKREANDWSNTLDPRERPKKKSVNAT